MGNCCGGQSDENFRGAGRTLGSAGAGDPESTPPRPVPVTSGNKLGGRNAPRPLGGSGAGAEGSTGDARSAAARAAEARASASNTPKGKLGTQLDAQKKQTRTNTLETVSKDERAARAQDDNVDALRHD